MRQLKVGGLDAGPRIGASNQIGQSGLAARFTHERRENFGICLPVWLAKHNSPLRNGFGHPFSDAPTVTT